MSLKVGQVVTVFFKDHAMGDKEVKPVDARVHGKIDFINEEYIRINFWDSDGEHPEEYESLCIIRSCVQSVTVWLEGIHVKNT